MLQLSMYIVKKKSVSVCTICWINPKKPPLYIIYKFSFTKTWPFCKIKPKSRIKPNAKRLDKFQKRFYYTPTRRRIEQLAARRAHNPEVVGSSPTPAIKRFAKSEPLFLSAYLSSTRCNAFFVWAKKCPAGTGHEIMEHIGLEPTTY